MLAQQYYIGLEEEGKAIIKNVATINFNYSGLLFLMQITLLSFFEKHISF